MELRFKMEHLQLGKHNKELEYTASAIQRHRRVLLQQVLFTTKHSLSKKRLCCSYVIRMERQQSNIPDDSNILDFKRGIKQKTLLP